MLSTTIKENLTDELSDEYINSENEIEEETEEAEITHPFDPTQIRIDSKQFTIDLVLSRIRHQELNLTPDFQRQAGIWSNEAKSRLIESILLRIPLPAFYIDATDEDKWLVVDGLQRLTALKQFILDKSLKLSGLEFLTHLKEKKYDELPRDLQRRILETQITVYSIEKGTPPEVKFNIFKRINTGGLPLSLQEIRYALNQGKEGKATKFLSKLAKLPEFKKAAPMTERGKSRMEDQEFILRFLAFSLISYRDYTDESLDYLLNKTMNTLNRINEMELSELELNFKKAMRVAQDIFGQYAFRKRIKDKPTKKSPLNKALFESWSVNLSVLNDDQLFKLIQKKEQLNERFIDLMEDDKEFMMSISQSTGQVSRVRYRFQKIQELIQELIEELI